MHLQPPPLLHCNCTTNAPQRHRKYGCCSKRAGERELEVSVISKWNNEFVQNRTPMPALKRADWDEPRDNEGCDFKPKSKPDSPDQMKSKWWGIHEFDQYHTNVMRHYFKSTESSVQQIAERQLNLKIPGTTIDNVKTDNKTRSKLININSTTARIDDSPWNKQPGFLDHCTSIAPS